MSNNQKTKVNDEGVLASVMFLTVLVIFAIASIGVAVSHTAGVFFSSVLCVVLTVLAVVAIATIYGDCR